jgi:cob(I)alamin adenosyltransferase
MTALLDGERVAKSSIRIETNGALDEANAWVGAGRAFIEETRLDDILLYIQHKLYDCTAAVAAPNPEGASLIAEEDVAILERAIDWLTEETEDLEVFVLPGGTPAAAMLHVARTVTRRAERRLVALAQTESISTPMLSFVNRLSDLLFQAARYANQSAGMSDTKWQKAFKAPKG